MTIQPGPRRRDVDGDLDGRVVTFFDKPGDDFQPFFSEAPRLEHFGLPVPPDPNELPAYYEFLQRFYKPPITWYQASLMQGAVQALRPNAQPTSIDQTLIESSRNWSGLYITPRDGLMFTAVYGVWNVPAPQLPSPGAVANDCHSSTWIGLDGQRAYYNTSLPQIGTEQYLEQVGSTVVAKTRSFWQWWSRENPGSSLPLGLPVQAGDEVGCLLLVTSATTVRFLMANLSHGFMLSVFETSVPPQTPTLKVSGATAEWVVERSTHPIDGHLQELPKLNDVDFILSGAVSALNPLLVPPFRDSTLIGARRITMRKSVDLNTRSVPIERPNSIVPPNQQQADSFEDDFVA